MSNYVESTHTNCNAHRTQSHDVELLDQLGIFDRGVVEIGRVCASILHSSLYSVIKEQYSTRCLRGIEYPSFFDNPLHLSTLRDFDFRQILASPQLFREHQTSVDIVRCLPTIPVPHPTAFDFRLSTLRTLSTLSGTLRPKPWVRLLRIVQNIEFSKNILSDAVESTRLSLARFDIFRFPSLCFLFIIFSLLYTMHVKGKNILKFKKKVSTTFFDYTTAFDSVR